LIWSQTAPVDDASESNYDVAMFTMFCILDPTKNGHFVVQIDVKSHVHLLQSTDVSGFDDDMIY